MAVVQLSINSNADLVVANNEDSFSMSWASPPDDFLCPITREVMKEPLLCRTGSSFERKAIVTWLSQHNGTCPLTRRPLSASDFVPDRGLERRIQEWCATNSMTESLQQETSLYLQESDDRSARKQDKEESHEDLLLTCLASSLGTSPSSKQEGLQSKSNSDKGSGPFRRLFGFIARRTGSNAYHGDRR